MRSKLLWIAFALAVVLSLTATASGKLPTLITGKQIAPHSLTSRHLVDHTIQAHDLSGSLIASLKTPGAAGPQGAVGPQGPKGDSVVGPRGATGAKGDKGDTGDKGATGAQGPPGLSNVEADGPYPSLTQLGDYPNAGENSTAAWASGDSLQQSWVMCAPGKVAVGGGFGQDDVQTDKLTIVTSTPVQIEEGKTFLENPAIYKPIDAEGSFVPNGWLVQGYNHSGADLVVRPWVICGTVTK